MSQISPDQAQSISSLGTAMGIMSTILIVFGALVCIGIITIPLGAVMIWMGASLKSSKQSFQQAAMGNDPIGGMMMGITSLKSYFLAYSILMIVALLFVFIGLAAQ